MADTLVKGDGTTNLDINTTASNTVGSNPYFISIPDGTTQARVRFRFPDVGAGTRYYYVDDIIYTGTFKPQFIAGPFIIMPEDTAKAGPIIRAFNNPLAVANRVNVFKLDEDVDVDIRYTLYHKPLVGIYNDGGNANIHVTVFSEAAFLPAYYRVLAAGVILDSTSCYTLATTPHWGVNSYTGTVKTRLDNLASFLRGGGNFFAQCEGIDAVENYPDQKYMTTQGFLTSLSQNTPVQYKHTDMPMLQFHGVYERENGSVSNFKPVGGNSNWLPTRYSQIFSVQPGNDTLWNAAVAKFTPKDSLGGNVFYLSGHNYSGNSLANKNGMRLLLNAAFVPPIERDVLFGNAESNSPVCEGDTIKLSLTHTGAFLSYSWTGPAAFSSNLQNPNIPNATLARAGTYTGTVTDAAGCFAAFETNVVVNTKPNITASATPATICGGSATTLSFTPEAGVSVVGWFEAGPGCVPTGASLGTANTSGKPFNYNHLCGDCGNAIWLPGHSLCHSNRKH